MKSWGKRQLATIIFTIIFGLVPVDLAWSVEPPSTETVGDAGPAPINNPGRAAASLRRFTPETLGRATQFGENPEPFKIGWSIVPGLTIRETFTDNVFLTPSREKADLVTEISPRIRIYANQRRLSFLLDYTLQNLIYAGNNDQTTYFHQLFSAGSAELSKQLLFLDASASITQQNLTTTGRGAFTNFGSGTFLGGVGDNVNITGERQDVLTYSLSPYLVHSFSDIADVKLRFSYDEVRALSGQNTTSQATATDSHSMNYFATVNSGSRFNRSPWSLAYSRREVNNNNNNNTDTTFEEVLGTLRLVYTPKLSLLGDVGYQRNQFRSAQGTRDDIIWDIGARWAPSARTKLEATYGQRFFGDRYSLDFTHQRRRLTWHLNYTEQQQLARQLQIDQATLAQGGAIPILDPITKLPILAGGGIPRLSDEVFVTRRFSGGVVFDGARNQFSLLGFHEQRAYQLSQLDDRLFGLNGLWTRTLSPRTNFDLNVGWTSVDTSSGLTSGLTANQQDDLFNVGCGLRHRFGRRVNGNVEYRRVERSSSNPEADLTENRLMAAIILSF